MGLKIVMLFFTAMDMTMEIASLRISPHSFQKYEADQEVNPDNFKCAPFSSSEIQTDYAGLFSAVNGKSVLFLGDSLLQQLFKAIQCASDAQHGNVYSTKWHYQKEYNVLMAVGESLGKRSRGGLNGHFCDVVKSYDHVIMNLGHHEFRSSEQLLADVADNDKIQNNVANGGKATVTAEWSDGLKSFDQIAKNTFDNVQKCLSREKTIPPILWVGHPPSHFNTTDGGYKDGCQMCPTTNCACVSSEQMRQQPIVQNSRIAEQLAQKYGFRYISIWQDFETNCNAAIWHPVDCTHYAMSQFLWTPVIRKITAAIRQVDTRKVGMIKMNPEMSERKKCDMTNYAKGKWAHMGSMKKNYVCCSWDGDKGSGGSEDCQRGKGVPGLEASYSGEGAPFKYIMSGGHSCSCDSQPSSLDRVLDFEKYAWQPSTCQMDAFDANRFCLMLGNRSILIVGDSTAEQTGSTLMNMIRAGSSDGYACSKNVQVRLTDSFGMGTDRAKDASTKWFERHESNFMSLVSDTIGTSAEDDVVILSSGPHWHDKQKYQAMLNSIKTKIEDKRKESGARVFLWKTINGAGCGTAGTTEGLNEEDAKRFTWDGFMEYDAMAEAVMQSMSPPVPVVNMSMLYQRGDAHPGSDAYHRGNHNQLWDCVHFCSPGPLDVVAPILSHVLQQVLPTNFP